MDDGGTQHLMRGRGDYFARLGIAKYWIAVEDGGAFNKSIGGEQE